MAARWIQRVTASRRGMAGWRGTSSARTGGGSRGGARRGPPSARRRTLSAVLVRHLQLPGFCYCTLCFVTSEVFLRWNVFENEMSLTQVSDKALCRTRYYFSGWYINAILQVIKVREAQI